VRTAPVIGWFVVRFDSNRNRVRRAQQIKQTSEKKKKTKTKTKKKEREKGLTLETRLRSNFKTNQMANRNKRFLFSPVAMQRNNSKHRRSSTEPLESIERARRSDAEQ
jgi:hypothetical protein